MHFHTSPTGENLYNNVSKKRHADIIIEISKSENFFITKILISPPWGNSISHHFGNYESTTRRYETCNFFGKKENYFSRDAFFSRKFSFSPLGKIPLSPLVKF